MPYRPKPIEKTRFTRKEAAALVGVHPLTLRTWERKYKALRPRLNRAGRVRYDPDDVLIAKAIKARRTSPPPTSQP